MSSSDRRRLPRHNLVHYLKVFSAEDDKLLGRVVDLNEEGLMLVSDDEVETGKLYKLRLQLSGDNMTTQELFFSAECRWCKRDVNPDLFVAGYKLDEMEKEASAAVRSLIKELGM